MRKVELYSRFNLGTDDIKVLSNLYIPLIGTDAVSLYFFYYGLLDSSTLHASFDLEVILNLLDWTLKRYNMALNKLEAIMLVKNYQKENDNLLVLLPPYTPNNFINDTVLGAYLKGRIEDEGFKLLLKRFILPNINLEGYSDISQSFSSIFKAENKLKIDHNNRYLGKKPNLNIKLKTNIFDEDLFYLQIDTNYLKEGMNNQFKKEVKSIAYLYGFSNQDMLHIYKNSINKNGYIELRTLKEKAKSYYCELNPNHEAVIVEKASNPNDEVKLFFKQASAKDILVQIFGDAYPKDLNIVNKFINSEDLNIGLDVVNCLLYYVCLNKEAVPSVSYLNKVRDSWLEKGYDDFDKAFDYINTLNDRKTEVVKGKAKSDLEKALAEIGETDLLKK